MNNELSQKKKTAFSVAIQRFIQKQPGPFDPGCFIVNVD